MGEEFRIEPAALPDLGELRHLEKACFGSDAWPWLELALVLTLPRIVRLKAVVGDHLAGFISGERRIGEKCGWITNLCVDSEYRKRGIARALLSRCEEEINMQKVRLSVRRSNVDALRLYYQSGYQSHQVWPRYYSGGEDALVLEKKLL
ncbi:MAG TPA: GNAT family N-acetyltransferase [Levilinea sp.]|nr:GNAT family N-acetyltransferase [Levilinea sp.]